MAPFKMVVPMLEVEIPKELFDKIKDMKEDDFDRLLYERIAAMNRYFEMNDEKALLKRKKELEKKIARMKEEIEDLTRFCDKAEEDQERMERWIDELDLENKELLKEMREDGYYVKSGKIKEEKIQGK
jgi:septal ring factor EnvC (AmiA/AmiB activator)